MLHSATCHYVVNAMCNEMHVCTGSRTYVVLAVVVAVVAAEAAAEVVVVVVVAAAAVTGGGSTGGTTVRLLSFKDDPEGRF